MSIVLHGEHLVSYIPLSLSEKYMLLATYAVMHADAQIWSKANIWSGHVDTVCLILPIQLCSLRAS